MTVDEESPRSTRQVQGTAQAIGQPTATAKFSRGGLIAVCVLTVIWLMTLIQTPKQAFDYRSKVLPWVFANGALLARAHRVPLRWWQGILVWIGGGVLGITCGAFILWDSVRRQGGPISENLGSPAIFAVPLILGVVLIWLGTWRRTSINTCLLLLFCGSALLISVGCRPRAHSSQPAIVLTGTLTDSAGLPMPGVTVCATAVNGEDTSFHYEMDQNEYHLLDPFAETDKEGKFIINIGPGFVKNNLQSRGNLVVVFAMVFKDEGARLKGGPGFLPIRNNKGYPMQVDFVAVPKKGIQMDLGTLWVEATRIDGR